MAWSKPDPTSCRDQAPVVAVKSIYENTPVRDWTGGFNPTTDGLVVPSLIEDFGTWSGGLGALFQDPRGTWPDDFGNGFTATSPIDILRLKFEPHGEIGADPVIVAMVRSLRAGASDDVTFEMRAYQAGSLIGTTSVNHSGIGDTQTVLTLTLSLTTYEGLEVWVIATTNAGTPVNELYGVRIETEGACADAWMKLGENIACRDIPETAEFSRITTEGDDRIVEGGDTRIVGGEF